VYPFPEPHIADLNFSFSGLKTAFLYFIQKQQKENPDFILQHLNDICASIQDRIISVLMHKLLTAAEKFDIKNIAIAGGVSSNSGLRNALTEYGKQHHWNIFIPKFEYCTDNAAMIAAVAHHKFLKNDFAGLDLIPVARMQF
ncbi:MAG: tRNA (adenosine(37)-N6)-threonylcarbamoyltransferase complex transferase subunit TsaD, partial [Ignavibacteria bacterium]|nr:tRNA (adenosine(37)-N6)-threonylcarbamoyltransferase complex transferase subunit TsaD [Ignavibacteria bacterium]